MLHLFLEHGAFLAKASSLLSAIAFGVTGITKLISPQDFTHFVLAGWIIIIAVAIVVVEGVNEAAPLILDNVPALRRLKNRGVFYAIIGTLVLGSDWKPLGPASGLGLILSGALWTALAIINTQKEADASARISAANAGINERDFSISSHQQGDPSARTLSRTIEKAPLDLNSNPTAFFRYEDDGGTPHVANGNYAQV
eukprot:Protomagalhaensia_sp_Gyna_25__4966@NODE_53_length_6056_cov_78_686222_g40_i0_p5_GENE_NODE_53_length_6056_cov_78_686222_g40_i0NODE_53_length_6056_cov_78_686222_g40_i0_p5_ORF_typecomplete_len198_score13_75COPI_assoc/PF08507_10/1_2e11DUF3427/PF11907_8/0_19MauE/PF07291_11/0_19MauE/PF07291_11/5_5e02DUF3784/PF12650_7/4_2DUF3784/PF12650_7/4_4e02_NODE_53_length_6056_cov_78_686222_g40_i024373030